MKVVGLTGGIGSGKTTVANFFKALGTPVYIADDEAKKLMNTVPEVKGKISRLFGEKAYHEGALNKKFIADTVFQNKPQLEALNTIVHPAVEKHFQEWKQQQQAVYIIYEAAILFETGGYKKFDCSILVTAAHEDKIDRLLKRDKTSRGEIEARMANQWDDEKKIKFADFVINNKGFSSTGKKVLKIHHILLKTV